MTSVQQSALLGSQYRQSRQPTYVDRPHYYVFTYNTIPANGTVTGLYQLIDNDADFFWRGVEASSTDNQFFGVRFQDPNGYYLSDDFMSGFVIGSQYLAQPFPIMPALYCPAGSKIVIDLQDQSGLLNGVLITFIGTKRYMLS